MEERTTDNQGFFIFKKNKIKYTMPVNRVPAIETFFFLYFLESGTVNTAIIRLSAVERKLAAAIIANKVRTYNQFYLLSQRA